MDVDGFCFLLISSGWGAGDRESPLIRAGYRLAEEEQRGGAWRGQACKAKNGVGMRPVAKARHSRETHTPVINAWNAVNVSSGWRRAVAKSTFCSHNWTVSRPWALKESKYPAEGVSLVQHAEPQCKIQPNHQTQQSGEWLIASSSDTVVSPVSSFHSVPLQWSAIKI